MYFQPQAVAVFSRFLDLVQSLLAFLPGFQVCVLSCVDLDEVNAELFAGFDLFQIRVNEDASRSGTSMLFPSLASDRAGPYSVRMLWCRSALRTTSPLSPSMTLFTMA